MNGADRQQRIGEYRQRLADTPEAKVFAPLADLLRQEGELEEALALLAGGLDRHPAYLTARVVQGRTLLDAGRSREAREVLRSILDDDPENLVVLRLLAEDALGRGVVDEAVPWLESLVVLDPEPDLWQTALDRSRPASRPASAASGEPSTVTGNQDPGFATMTLVDIYLAQGYRDKARTALERILARDPGRQDAREKLAALADEPAEIGDRPSLDSVLDGPADPAARRRQRTERRSEDKKKFSEWIDRLRDEGSPAS